MQVRHVEQCQERGGATDSQIAQNFHIDEFALVGRMIRCPIILVLHSITAIILLTTLKSIKVPSTKLNVQKNESMLNSSGVTIHSSNQ